MTTVVAPGWRESLITRSWKAHKEAEELITQQCLALIATHVSEMPFGDQITHLELDYSEAANFYWEITIDKEDEGIHKVDAYDFDPELADWLAEWTPYIWEFGHHLLLPYTEDGKVLAGDAGLETARFTIERMLAGPRDEESQRVILNSKP